VCEEDLFGELGTPNRCRHLLSAARRWIFLPPSHRPFDVKEFWKTILFFPSIIVGDESVTVQHGGLVGIEGHAGVAGERAVAVLGSGVGAPTLSL